MSQIITLDEHLANQIAAGEVVERPASVIKELVENAIDAGAKNISISITWGGIESMEVIDDGSGIAKDDLKKAVEKYSTSKIQNLEDLHNVMTFGFRGEALWAIASVSRFTLRSTTNSQNRAYELTPDGDIQESSHSEGTSVLVEDLFYNTPARLNYLKKPRTEYNHIHDFLYKIALSHPELGIHFISDDTEIFRFRSWESQKDRIYRVYGSEVSENLLKLEFSYGGISLKGYITDPKVFFTNKNRQALFVNTRSIGSGLIYKAISDAYNRFIPPKTFPAYVLNVDIDPTQIDVNVHPRKLEIRFAHEQSIFRLFYHGVKEVLEKVSLVSDSSQDRHSLTTSYQGEKEDRLHKGKLGGICEPEYYTGSGTKFKSYSPYTNTTTNPKQSQISEVLEFSKKVMDVPAFEKSLDLHDTPLGRVIGQMHNSYIILETLSGVKILDQHALAERVIYEKLVHASYTPITQQLLIAENCQLTPSESDIFEKSQDTFRDMGFDIEALSGNVVLIQGVPDFVKRENTIDIFRGILADLSEGSNASTTLSEVRHRIWAYTACRSAIKFWDKLSIFEMNQLLHDAALDYSATCPHGRPVVWEMSLEELKGKYER